MPTISGYIIKEQLSDGRHYKVLRCESEDGQKQVIFKACRLEHPGAEELTLLRHEYHLLQLVDHPQVIKAYELVKHHHQLYLMLEDIGGYALRRYLKEQPLSLDVFFKVALQVVDALHGLHTQSIIHKDINPDNIIIEPKTLTVKVIDLGISSQLTQQVSALTPEHLEGTLAYLSPEQTGRTNALVDYRTDFYALGVTFYEMLAKRLPFIAEDPLELIYCHLAKIAPPLKESNPQVPQILCDIINKLMAKLPGERYASATGLKADLLECQQQWQANQDIKPFPLSQQDVSGRLTLSQKLYGREDAINHLLEVFERVSQGATELLLVSGYSGIGKTALVKEVYKPITRQHGYFVSGKYDQLQRATPYSALIEAFQDLANRLLAEPQIRLTQWKEQLLAALGQHAQVLIKLIPNLGLILGEQPDVSELPPEQEQQRLLVAFQALVQVLAQADHPLVLFIDDLQWADSVSLQLISQLLTNTQLKYFFLIGAYRDNEVSIEHPLSLILQQLQKTKLSINTIQVTPLQQKDITQLLADSFNDSLYQKDKLVERLWQKTQGNPFFLNEFIKSLYQKGLLFFSHEKKEWQWDSAQIDQETITDNVVDLLLTRILEFPQLTQASLSLAACIGHQFDLQTLAIISEQSLAETARHLWPAVQANLVKLIGQHQQILQTLVMDSEDVEIPAYSVECQFIHDRVQQAAYQLIPEDKKQQMHLQIANLLLKQQALTEKDERLFDILNHLNNSLDLITDPMQRLESAQYNLWAGHKAKQAAAYLAAVNYLNNGIKLLPQQCWENHYDLTFALHKELAECCYLSSQYERAEQLLQLLYQRANNQSETVDITLINIHMLTALGKRAEAFALIINLLQTLGLKLPRKAKPLHILWAVFVVKWQLGRRNVAELNFPPVKKSNSIFIAKLVEWAASIIHLYDKNMYVLLIFKVFQMNLKDRGFPPSISGTAIAIAIVMLHGFHRYHEALAFLALSKRMRQIVSTGNPLSIPRQKIAEVLFILPYQQKWDDCLQYALKAYQECLDAGEFTVALSCLGAGIHLHLACGNPLITVFETLQQMQHFQMVNKILFYEKRVQVLSQSFQILQQESGSLAANTEQLIHAISQAAGDDDKAVFYNQTILIHYLLGDFASALKCSQDSEIYFSQFRGSPIYTLCLLFYTLSLIACYLKVEKKTKHQYWKKIKALHKLIKHWASWCPVNFLHYDLLIKAECARIQGKRLEAEDYYDEAIEAAYNSENLLVLAVANECAARFYSTLDKPHLAKVYIQAAHYAYNQWGALAKCKLLEQQYPDWLQVVPPQEVGLTMEATVTHTHTIASTENISTSIDMLSILKSAQAVSSEIQLDRLLKKLLCIVLENAGAQNGMLLMKEGNDWYVKAVGTTAEQQIILNQTEPMEGRNDIPLSLLQYVQHSKEHLLLQSKEEFERYGVTDSYLIEAKPQSILIIPVKYQQELTCLFYLENRELSCAFTPQQIQILQLLAGQAAISLENARLYYQATHDSLTGLANRSLLYYLFQQSQSKIKQKQTKIGVLFFDLDGFKKINDTLGHDAGDKLLLCFTEKLKLSAQENAVVARLGGDEFIVMLDGLTDIQQAGVYAERFLEQLKTPVLIAGKEIEIASSIGISVYPHDGADIQTLLKKADIALYRVKEKGKKHYQFYTNE